MTGSQRLALIVAALTLLVGGFFVAKGSNDETVTTAPAQVTTTVATPTTTTTTTPTAPATPVVTVRGGKPVGGIKKLTFKKGDTIRFTVASDVADEVHVHGYDVMKDVTAGRTVTFAFDGHIDGIFEVELEGAAVQVASLKVTP